MTKPFKAPPEKLYDYIQRSVVEGEVADYQRQIQEAQTQANVWQQKLLMANGALQACQALLARLQSPPKEEPPAS